jgi:ketosteroid isomerase-like protein
MSDKEAVRQANRAFYDAFETLEVERMERIWLQEPHIVCIHPGWRPLSGWGPIMHSWERIFDSTFEMKFEISEVQLRLHGDVAIVVVQENLTQRGYDGVVKSTVLATNVYERTGGEWKMVLHHGSPVAMPRDDEPPIQ